MINKWCNFSHTCLRIAPVTYLFEITDDMKINQKWLIFFEKNQQIINQEEIFKKMRILKSHTNLHGKNDFLTILHNDDLM